MLFRSRYSIGTAYYPSSKNTGGIRSTSPQKKSTGNSWSFHVIGTEKAIREPTGTGSTGMMFCISRSRRKQLYASCLIWRRSGRVIRCPRERGSIISASTGRTTTRTWNGKGGGRNEEEKAPPAMKQKEPCERSLVSGWIKCRLIRLTHPANGDLHDSTATDRMLRYRSD